MDINELKDKEYIKIIVKPNSAKNEIKDYDKEKNVFRVDISAPAEKNKANIEVIKFFSKLLKKKVIIARGLKSKEKIIKIISS